MKGRMLHSRIVELDCEVPPEESRKFDITSWDKQHTYYYYLGNEPKKVATPFQVKFLPLSFRVKEDLADWVFFACEIFFIKFVILVLGYG